MRKIGRFLWAHSVLSGVATATILIGIGFGLGAIWNDDVQFVFYCIMMILVPIGTFLLLGLKK